MQGGTMPWMHLQERLHYRSFTLSCPVQCEAVGTVWLRGRKSGQGFVPLGVAS